MNSRQGEDPPVAWLSRFVPEGERRRLPRTPSKFACECPKGHGKVWGKPGLQLNCGACGKRDRSEALAGGDHTNQAAARCVSNETIGPDSPRSNGTTRRD